MIFLRINSGYAPACDACNKTIQPFTGWFTNHKDNEYHVCGGICMRRLTEKLAMEERNAIHPNKL